MFKVSFDTSFWGWDSLIKQTSLRQLTDEVIATKSARAFAVQEYRNRPADVEIATHENRYRLLK
jgi:hypothetical protein